MPDIPTVLTPEDPGFYRWGMIYENPSAMYRGVRPLTAGVVGGPCSEMCPAGKNTSWVTLDGTCDDPPILHHETAMLARIALADLGIEMIETDIDRIVPVYQ